MKETFCVYPWINLHTNTDGRCKLCCHVYGEDYITVDGEDAVLGKTEFDKIWHGDYMTDVRDKMLSGRKVSECQRCYDHEDKGLESSRQWANKMFPIKNAEIFDPTHLELRLGNHCNLKCNSCWSVSSDQLYKERKKIMSKESVPQWLSDQWNHEIHSVEQFDWQWFETDEFKHFVDRVAPTLKRLYLTGGEPTLIDANRYVLDQLVKSGNKDCHVAWTTNMTTWPQEFYDKLDFFHSSEIQMSIDGFKDHNSYIRYPTAWEKVEQNFAHAMQLPHSVQLKIYFVYQAWNIFDVEPLITWLQRAQGNRRVDFVPIFLEHPDQIHSCVWPEHVRHSAVEQLQSINTVHHRDPVSRIVNYTVNTNKYSVENLQKMKQFVEINDRYRRRTFGETFPELNSILEQECKT